MYLIHHEKDKLLNLTSENIEDFELLCVSFKLAYTFFLPKALQNIDNMKFRDFRSIKTRSITDNLKRHKDLTDTFLEQKPD
jgi:uncharacterized protein (DUF4213/DUF364 family)